MMKILSLLQPSQHIRPQRPQNSVPARITNIGVPEGLRQFSGPRNSVLQRSGPL